MAIGILSGCIGFLTGLALWGWYDRDYAFVRFCAFLMSLVALALGVAMGVS